MIKIDEKFLTDEEQKRADDLKKYELLYDGLPAKVYNIVGYFEEDKKKSEALYVAVNLPALITDQFADMVAAGKIFFDVKETELQEKINEWVKRTSLKRKTYEFAVTQSQDGFAVAKIREKDGKAVLEQIPNKQYFPIYSNTIDSELIECNIISQVRVLNAKREKIAAVFVEHYAYAPDGRPTLEYQLWQTDASRKLKSKLPVTLLDPNIPTEVQILNTTRIPIYQINNIKRGYEEFGQSDYKKVMDLFNQLNLRVTQISEQLWKHLNAKLAVPEGTVDENGEVKALEFDMIEVPENSVYPKYITNDNPQIENGFKKIDFIIKMISAITKIPLETFGIDTHAGAEKVEAMRIRQYPIIRKVDRKRMYFEDVYETMIKEAMLIEGNDMTGVNVSIVWSDALPEDRWQKTVILTKELAAKIISKKTALKRDYGFDDKEADEELARIREDEEESIDLQVELQKQLDEFNPEETKTNNEFLDQTDKNTKKVTTKTQTGNIQLKPKNRDGKLNNKVANNNTNPNNQGG
jgi:hypothetical protein